MEEQDQLPRGGGVEAELSCSQTSVLLPESTSTPGWVQQVSWAAHRYTQFLWDAVADTPRHSTAGTPTPNSDLEPGGF